MTSCVLLPCAWLMSCYYDIVCVVSCCARSLNLTASVSTSVDGDRSGFVYVEVQVSGSFNPDHFMEFDHEVHENMLH